MTRSRQTADWGSRAGLAKVIPSSVAVGSGTGSADTTGKVTFTTVSSVSLNSVFTSAYTNYRIVTNFVVSTNDQGVTFRFRVSGSDNTTTNYVNRVGRVLSGGISANDTIARDYFGVNAIQTASTGRGIAIYDISNPSVAEVHPIFASSSTDYGAYFGSGYFQSATAFDGFTLYVGSGTLTGTVTVYGYN